jgi:hypothetical protein
MVVALVTVSDEAVVVPNFTADAVKPGPLKFVPVIVTVVPPAVVPEVGVNEEMVGAGATYLNLDDAVAMPPGVATFTVTVPATCDGVTALMVLALVTVKLVADVIPNLTDVIEIPGPEKLEPAMVTAVPPLVEPVDGEIEEMLGALTGSRSCRSTAP